MVMVPALDEFLDFMARLAQAQHQVLSGREPSGVRRRMPSIRLWRIACRRWAFVRCAAIWTGRVICARSSMRWRCVGERQRPLLQALRDANADALQAIAEDVLEQRAGSADTRGLMPLVAAALQVAWVAPGGGLTTSASATAGRGPSLVPVLWLAARSELGAQRAKSQRRALPALRAVCNGMAPGGSCSNCETGGQLLYLGLDDEQGEPFPPVQAEACGGCESYLKIVLRATAGRADPVADDLASLALDLMLAEEGEYVSQRLQPVARLR